MSIEIPNFTEEDIKRLSDKDKMVLIRAIEERDNRINNRAIYYKWFNKDSQFPIDKYPKHKDFFKAGLDTKQRMFIAANRVGKTYGAGFEIVCHALMWYPEWWQGRRVEMKQHEIQRIWIGADTNQNSRDVIQEKLLGSTNLNTYGTGLIPRDSIKNITSKTGVNGLADTITVRRSDGGITEIILKSYQQGREPWQGTQVNIIWLDEEPPHDIYQECVMRLLTGNGFMLLTFTPLNGLTKLITEYQENCEKNPKDFKKFNISVYDAAHISKEEIEKALPSIPEWQRNARLFGIPSLGSGAIYRFKESEVFIDPIPLPSHWKKCYAMDIGWNTTAILFAAVNPDNNNIYVYDEIYVNEKQPFEYARMVKDRGEWIPGVVDPSSNQSNQKDGTKILNILKGEGLDLGFPDKAVETGLFKTFEALNTGRLKIFNTCVNTIKEYRIYRRDEKGNIIKEKDHAMDAMRYLIMGGVARAKSYDDYKREIELRQQNSFMFYGGHQSFLG